MYALSQGEIERLLQGRPITDEWPWNTGDEATVDNHYRDVLAEVCRKCNVLERTEWKHYGSGYASYVDCWLYRDSEEFQRGPGNDYNGLVVLLSRLSPFYVLAEGEKSLGVAGGMSYLPHADMADSIKTPAVVSLIEPVSTVLKARGLVRLFKSDLQQPLPAKTLVPTILESPPWRHFDALFHWED